jgi:hypothetical protein
MKITGPESLQQTRPGSTPAQKTSVDTANFGNMLRKTLEQPVSSGGVQGIDSLSEPRAVQNIGQQTFQPESIVDRTSRAIDLLEMYSKALSDPQKSLRDIEPELTAFVSETESLYEAYLEAGHDDPRLKNVLEDLLRTARLEGIRFQRGDYLDTV